MRSTNQVAYKDVALGASSPPGPTNWALCNSAVAVLVVMCASRVLSSVIEWIAPVMTIITDAGLGTVNWKMQGTDT